MDMTRATNLEGNIDDELWPELVLAMTYIKNSRPTRALADNLSPHEAHFHEKPDLSHLRILGSTRIRTPTRGRTLNEVRKVGSTRTERNTSGF